MPWRRTLLAFALVGLAVLPALPAEGVEHDAAPICIAFGSPEHADLARATAALLAQPTLVLDVRPPVQRSRLAQTCTRLVVALGSQALRAAKENFGSARVLSALVDSPEALIPSSRLAGSFLRDVAPAQVFSTLGKLAPAVRRVGTVYDPARSRGLVQAAHTAARAAGLELVALPASDIGAAVRAFHRFERELAIDALWLLPDGTTTVHETVYYAMEIAHWRRLVLIGLSHWYVANGALFAMVPDPHQAPHDLANLARKAAAGEAISPLTFASSHTLLINTRTAQRLGLRLAVEFQTQATLITP